MALGARDPLVRVARHVHVLGLEIEVARIGARQSRGQVADRRLGRRRDGVRRGDRLLDVERPAAEQRCRGDHAAPVVLEPTDRQRRLLDREGLRERSVERQVDHARLQPHEGVGRAGEPDHVGAYGHLGQADVALPGGIAGVDCGEVAVEGAPDDGHRPLVWMRRTPANRTAARTGSVARVSIAPAYAALCVVQAGAIMLPGTRLLLPDVAPEPGLGARAAGHPRRVRHRALARRRRSRAGSRSSRS